MSQARVAVDVGSQLAKIITAGSPSSGTERVRLRPVGYLGTRAVLAETAVTGAEICLAVPDAWLDGSEAGGRKQETLRRITEDELGVARVRWAGQLAAVAALTASREAAANGQSSTSAQAPPCDQAPIGERESGRYLICDVGGAGVRVALCEASALRGARYAVRQLAVHAVQGGGWRDFDEAVRAALGADADPGLSTWHEQAMSQGKRARIVFDRAKTAPDFLSARVYTLSGARADYELTAEQATECFAPTADRIKAGVAAVFDSARKPLATVLTGGLAWFPLAAATLIELAGRAPLILRPEAAARGALLLADDQAGLSGCDLPSVSVPMHELKDGMLTEVSMPLPWTTSFGEADGPLYIDDPELTLDIGARRVTVPLPELAAGAYRAAARPSWTGAGVLVLRTVASSRATLGSFSDVDPDVRIVSLAPYAKR